MCGLGCGGGDNDRGKGLHGAVAGRVEGKRLESTISSGAPMQNHSSAPRESQGGLLVSYGCGSFPAGPSLAIWRLDRSVTECPGEHKSHSGGSPVSIRSHASNSSEAQRQKCRAGCSPRAAQGASKDHGAMVRLDLSSVLRGAVLGEVMPFGH